MTGRFGAQIRLQVRDGKLTAAVEYTEDGERTGEVDLVQRPVDPEATSGPAAERPADLPPSGPPDGPAPGA